MQNSNFENETTFPSLPPSPSLLSLFPATNLFAVGGGGYDVECIVGAGGYVKDANNAEVRLCQPNGVAVHEPSHTCFVAEYGVHTIRQISFVN
jgi:hypothetical protein